MKITKEQFEEMGTFYLNDLPFHDSNPKIMLKLFNCLPNHIQALAISWGANDSVFRDDVFEYLCENQFRMTTKEYYDSNIFTEYNKENRYRSLDFTKLGLENEAIPDIVFTFGIKDNNNEDNTMSSEIGLNELCDVRTQYNLNPLNVFLTSFVEHYDREFGTDVRPLISKVLDGNVI